MVGHSHGSVAQVMSLEYVVTEDTREETEGMLESLVRTFDVSITWQLFFLFFFLGGGGGTGGRVGRVVGAGEVDHIG